MSSDNEKALPTSRTWKAMKKGMDIFDKGTRWSASRGSNIKFWLAFWTSKGPLRLIIHGPFSRGEEESKIKDIVWSWVGIVGKYSSFFQMILSKKFELCPTPVLLLRRTGLFGLRLQMASLILTVLICLQPRTWTLFNLSMAAGLSS